jgi:hypothetical protein
MLNRCTNPNVPHAHRYGGRGITVCDRWLEFTSFLEDMGPRPSPMHSVDRVNNDGNYEPTNCRWATIEQQAANRSTGYGRKGIYAANAFMVEHEGVIDCLKGWAERSGINYATIRVRIFSSGWDPVRAITQPSKIKRGKIGL